MQDTFDIVELAPVLLLGVIGGLLGSCFTYLNEKLAAWRKDGESRLHQTPLAHSCRGLSITSAPLPRSLPP